MPSEHVERFFALFFAGLGLVLAGLVNALRRHQTDRGRVLFAVLACGTLLGALWAWDPNPRTVSWAALFVALGTVPCLVAGSSWLAAAAARVAGLIRRPTARWGLIGVVGLGCVVGSVVRYEADDQQLADQITLDFELINKRPPLTEAGTVRALTDQGTEVTLKRVVEARPVSETLSCEQGFLSRYRNRYSLLCRSVADEGANCHGWVFGGGRFWIGGAQVEGIVKDNSYFTVSDPRPSDLVVYRDPGGVTHTAVVRYVTPGMPVLVEGKWGWMGVYLHPVEQSPYGTDYTYYRSLRAGHTLAGIAEQSPATPPAE